MNMFSDRNRPSEPRELNNVEKHKFLTSVGYARQNLRHFHMYLKCLNSDILAGKSIDADRVGRAVDAFVRDMEKLLGPWDRKPVFGNGWEFRLANEVFGLCAVRPGCTESLTEWILNGVINTERKIHQSYDIKEAINIVRASEHSLTEIYRKLSGNTHNRYMIP